MPKYVDHDLQRQEVAEIVATLIARAGIESVTVRAVAQEAGVSTAVVSHYFASKRELLLHCYRATAARATARVQAAMAVDDSNLEAVLAALLPIRADARRDWLVWFAFWGMAIADPEFSKHQRMEVKKARKTFATWLGNNPRLPTRRKRHVERIARQLLTLLMGTAIEAAFDPADWPATRQRAQFASILSELTTPAPRRSR
ncbi:MAG: TetR/AcrR family transcriptional regulator [Steroidobacteraceae bacterium]